MKETPMKRIECKCEQCHTPCIGTPQDILRMIEAGYADRLLPFIWTEGIMLGFTSIPVFMVQPITRDGWCSFLKNGLCELKEKGLKPSKYLAWNIAKEWMSMDNSKLIIKIVNKLKQ